MSTPTTYAVRIEWDENACTLILATDTGRVEYRLDDPEQVYDAVMGGIWPWLYEREQAFNAFRARVNGARFECDNPEEAWFETLRDGADLARKAAKEEAA